MGSSVAHKLIEAHLLDGELTPGEEIALRIDQTLAQDATGTMVMLGGRFDVRHDLSPRQVAVLLAGGLINAFRARDAPAAETV